MIVRLDEECGAIFQTEATRFSVTRLLTSSIPATRLTSTFWLLPKKRFILKNQKLLILLLNVLEVSLSHTMKI